MNIENVGKKVDKIRVEISYRIIELFSAGLYSSPNKAFEELVSNSYDAFSTKVSVLIPADLDSSNASICVCDNGESMDSSGLKLLWKIGSQHKRSKERDSRRLQIGKFGIGKLATYVLARKLTYICKVNNQYHAVTMDYSRIDDTSEKTEEIYLDERILDLSDVKNLLMPFIYSDGQYLLNFSLWGDEAADTWTFVIMSDLKPKTKEIREGRLKWVLRTALPLNPNFKLFYNGQELEPSKQEITPLKTWIIGKDDDTANNFDDYEITTYRRTSAINLKSLKNVYGTIDLYRDSLVTGKSEKLGRSHGIFLMVRGRLINTDDPLLGMDAFTHGVFNRTRFVIHANGLDDYITSTREAIKESEAFSQLQEYIKRKFNNEVRPFHWDLLDKEEKKTLASYKISSSPASLSRRPLLIVARKFLNGEITDPLFINVPSNLTTEEKEVFLFNLEDDLTSESGIIKDVFWEIMEPERLLASLDLTTRIAKVNLMHPFFANFSEELKTTLPFQLIALTEILTEAHLIELGVDQDIIRNIMLRRDKTLRELTFSDRPNAPFVATMLKDSVADSTGLEDAVYNAFNNLGFETTKLGGKNEPDGKAVAVLGYTKENRSAEYSIVYDAKSTSKNAIKAGTAKISSIVRHREKYKANFAVVIARDFEGAVNPASAVSNEAKLQSVTLLRVKDIIKIVLYSAPKQIGLAQMKELFQNCHTVLETSKWISDIEKKDVIKRPIKLLVETIFKLQKEDTEPPEIAAIRMQNKELRKMSKQEIITLVQSLETLVPNFINLEGEIVGLQAKPEKILEAIHRVTNVEIPVEFREAYLKAFD